MRGVGIAVVLLLLFGCGQPPQEKPKEPAPEGQPNNEEQKEEQPKDIKDLKLWGVSAGWSASVRPPGAPPGFYPTDISALKKELRKYLTAATPQKPGGKILGIVSPHAGFLYCWRTAAYAYKLLIGKKFDTVLILSTAHSGITSVCDTAFYNMPWGDVPVATDVVKALIKSGKFRYVPTAHEREHGIETQLPFLCFVMSNFKIVPVVVGADADGREKALAQALLDATKGRNVLVVVSTDLTHFPDHKTAKKVEDEFLEVVKTLDIGKIKEAAARLVKNNAANGVECVACGLEALCIAVEYLKARGAKKFLVLHHADSYENMKALPKKERYGTKPKESRVVGYASCIFVGD